MNHCLDVLRSRQSRMGQQTDSLDEEAAPDAAGGAGAGRGEPDRSGAGDRAAAAGVPGGVPAARRRGVRASGGRHDSGDFGRHVEIAGAQGAAADSHVSDAADESSVQASADRVEAMSCADYSEAIAEFVDGTLDPAQQRALERHVEGCAACRALVADLKSIQAAAFTLDRHRAARTCLRTPCARASPTSRCRQRAGGCSRGRASRTARGVWLAAAAALLVATMAGIYSAVRRPTPHADDAAERPRRGEPADVVASVQAELAGRRGALRQGDPGARADRQTDSGALDPQVAGVLQKNLQVIDQAIGESRAALQDAAGQRATRRTVCSTRCARRSRCCSRPSNSSTRCARAIRPKPDASFRD